MSETHPDDQPTIDTPPPAPPPETPEDSSKVSPALPPMSAITRPDDDAGETQPPTSDRSKSHGSHPPLPTAPAGAPDIPGYHLLHKVGEGGMGVVWKAVQLATRRPVALKLLGAASFGSDAARLRFEREVELAARLEHPFIARVYDSGQTTPTAATSATATGGAHGVHYYAMELVEGLDLETHVRGHSPQTRDTLTLMRDVCLGVQHAHQRGVIHRDLKPSNILVVKANHEDTKSAKENDHAESKSALRSSTSSSSIKTNAVPKIVDFGLAKTLLAEEGQPLLSQTGQVAGTPAYMSPEQAAGQTDRIDTRSDVYALGVILYRLLTGKYPHDTTVPFATLLRHISENDIVRPRQASGDASKIIDRELETLLLKALEKDPDRRYDNAGALAADLDNYLEGRPLLAKAPTTLYVLSKQLKRHRGLVATAALVVLLLGGGAVVGKAWLANRPVEFPIESYPRGAQVKINGVLRPGCGRTPCSAVLPPGTHTIELVLPGHYQSHIREVTVKNGQISGDAYEPIQLASIHRTFIFTTQPTRGRVEIRDQASGAVIESFETPGIATLPRNRYSLHIAAPGKPLPEEGELLEVIGNREPLAIHREFSAP